MKIVLSYILMPSRDQILQNIKKNKPAPSVDLPMVPDYVASLSSDQKIELFAQNLGDNHAQIHRYDTEEELHHLIKNLWMDVEHFHAPMLPYLHNSASTVDAADKVDVCVVYGSMAVANNGATWVEAKNMEHRSLPFLAKYLVVLLEESQIVYNLHEAYATLDAFDFDYGVWISGPSKTGDIEQALVIGAHGPLEMAVLIKK